MTVPLYPQVIYKGDLSPAAAGHEVDKKIKEINEACKGFGTDELRLIQILGNCSLKQRALIAAKYEDVYGKDLKTVMKKECGKGDFGTALQLLSVPADEAECDIIKLACKGVGTDELSLYPIICGRTNKEIDLLKKKFYKLYDQDLSVLLSRELGGHFEKIVFNCLQGIEEEFDADYHTMDLVSDDVATLHKMSKGKFGTDESGLFKLLCSRPTQHLKKVNNMYANKHDITLFKVMEDELGGQCRDATLFLLGMKLKPFDTVAKLIKKVCKGIGTNELLLSSIMIRYQKILKNVIPAYEELYGESLKDKIKSEAGGDYGRLLIELCEAAED